MIYEDIARNSPAMQVLKQLEAPLAVAQKTALRFDAIPHTTAAVAAMAIPQHSWISDMSEVTACLSKGLQKCALQPTLAERAIESLRKNLVAEAASMVTGWEKSLVASVFEDLPTQRVLEAMNRDWDPIAKAVKSAQEIWAVEASRFAKTTDLWRQDLARESASLAKNWNSAHATWALDTSRYLRALEPPRLPKILLDPTWAAPIFLEHLEPTRLTQIVPNNILSRRPFGNYRMAEAFDLLSDFERDLRDFIHDAMLEVFGAGWEKGRLPSGMYEKWVEKRQQAKAAGESSERLIDYADFTEYVSIISQKNNWNEVFQSRFRRLQFVQESLYRLQRVRVCTMHSRILPHNMWQVLQTETMLLSDKMWN